MTPPSAASGAGGRPRRRRLGLGRRGWLAAGLGAAAVVGLVSTALLFVWPRSDSPRRADALVVLGPGRNGERFEKAMELARRRLAPVLVVSTSRKPQRWPLQRDLCALPRAFCFHSKPFTTRGEARIVARLARDRGWRSLLVVTSTYHVTRARLLYGRCFPGRLTVVGARARGDASDVAATIVHEWGGLANALLLDRSC